MIFLVDDDPTHLETTSRALLAAGFAVRAFPGGREALKGLETDRPDLIVSDMMMPGMDGLAFRRAVAQRLPEERIPFIFLSAMDTPDDIVQGLEAGADDYLAKPVDPRVLTAKVRSFRSRSRMPAVTVFNGDLACYPFIKVLQFCETQGLSGEVEFTSGDLRAILPFQAGNPLLEVSPAGDDLLAALYDLREGAFVIRSRTLDFSGLEPAASKSGSPDPVSGVSSPAIPGRLSEVRAGNRVFQVQTEIIRLPSPQVLSVVVSGGNTVFKKAIPLPAGKTGDPAAELTALHQAVEREVLQRYDREAPGTDAVEDDSNQKRYYQLFEDGFEAFRREDYTQAIAAWEEALRILPEDRTLEVNLRVARTRREKLDRDRQGTV